MGCSPGKGDRQPSRPCPHVEDHIARADIDKPEIPLCCLRLLVADPMVGGSTLVPGGSRVAGLFGPFRGGHVDCLPEFVPVDNPVHGGYCSVMG